MRGVKRGGYPRNIGLITTIRFSIDSNKSINNRRKNKNSKWYIFQKTASVLSHLLQSLRHKRFAKSESQSKITKERQLTKPRKRKQHRERRRLRKHREKHRKRWRISKNVRRRAITYSKTPLRRRKDWTLRTISQSKRVMFLLRLRLLQLKRLQKLHWVYFKQVKRFFNLWK